MRNWLRKLFGIERIDSRMALVERVLGIDEANNKNWPYSKTAPDILAELNEEIDGTEIRLTSLTASCVNADKAITAEFINANKALDKRIGMLGTGIDQCIAVDNSTLKRLLAVEEAVAECRNEVQAVKDALPQIVFGADAVSGATVTLTAAASPSSEIVNSTKAQQEEYVRKIAAQTFDFTSSPPLPPKKKKSPAKPKKAR
jgi:hypothetical protein